MRFVIVVVGPFWPLNKSLSTNAQPPMGARQFRAIYNSALLQFRFITIPLCYFDALQLFTSETFFGKNNSAFFVSLPFLSNRSETRSFSFSTRSGDGVVKLSQGHLRLEKTILRDLDFNVSSIFRIKQNRQTRVNML